ncbi:kinase domain protein [Ceratobasidium sp. AG-Ba]|nr:kinase domain protein [Ceratobasidium sp. AG-Ba]QRW01992.1 kinase domain protein [Ceratobasidium sp. AG-Ba]
MSFPFSARTAFLLSWILHPSPQFRPSIDQMRDHLTRIPRLLLTPVEAARAPNNAHQVAHDLYAMMARRRPYLLVDHYEDICLHYPEVADILCDNLRSHLIKNRIVDGLDGLFSVRDRIEAVVTELPDWAQPVTVETHPEQLDNIEDYPQSPDMSRDHSTGTTGTTGPITPATRPAHVVDNVPVVQLDDADQVADTMDHLKVSEDNVPPVVPSSSSSVLASIIGPRIARVFGSAGDLWFR